MKRQNCETVQENSTKQNDNKKQKKELPTIAIITRFDPMLKNIKSLTFLVQIKNKKILYQITTADDYDEKKLLTDVFDVFNKIKSFNLIGYGISLLDIKIILAKCEQYNIDYSVLNRNNIIDIHRDIPKFTRLINYTFDNVVENVLNAETKTKSDYEHCDLCLELFKKIHISY